ncbi:MULTISPECIES: hypothetical protein [Bacteroides]|uniref:hypothetical protein n=1 Tax=Bacteroides TaxID=816 RepID=UPI00206C8237|nr:hypothetical protein [Bacteroides nordii]MBD9112218.1 hypothetical protein [Bacteroides nordii]DAR04446.1 MAG TPA: hypothetical protein [Caudoviricetes sp.]
MGKLPDYEIKNTMRDLLINNERIASCVNGNILPVVLNEETKGDAIFYKSYGLKSESNNMGITLFSMKVCYTVVSSTCGRTDELAWLIVDTLIGTYENPYMKIKVSDSDEDGESPNYMKPVEFLVEW